MIDSFGSELKLTNEVINGKVICQSFVALCSRLYSISIAVATYKRINNCNICFEICDNANGTSLFKHICYASILNDNSFFKFIVNIELEPQKRYDLVIYSDGTITNSVTFKYGIKKHLDETFIISNNRIDNGELCCVFSYELSNIINEKKIKDSILEKKLCNGLVSIIIPVFNSQSYLNSLFDSIISQTYNHYEIIVVDDGSNDHNLTEEVISKYSNLNIKLIKNIQNHGANTARNIGAFEAHGEFLFFCDSDVILNSKIFQKEVQVLHDNPDCSWVYSNFSVGTDERAFIPFSYEELKKRNLCSTMSMIRHKDFVGFRNSLKRLQDWDLFLTMSENGKKGIWINEFLFSAADRVGITNNSISWSQAVSELKRYHKI